MFGSRGDHASPSQAQFLSQWGKNKVLRHTLRKEFPRKSMSAERKSVLHLVCEAVVPWSAECMTRKMGNKETGGKEAEQRLERSTRQSGLKAWGQGCFSLNKCKVKDTSFFFKSIFGSNLFEKKRQSNQVSPSNYVLLHTER